jgi:hypothetical protein
LTLHQTLELASLAVTVVGLPFAVWVFMTQQRKERENEEEEAYQHLSDAYNDFLKVVLAHADLQLRTASALPDPTSEQRERMQVIFDMLISLFPGCPQAADERGRTAALEQLGRLHARVVPARGLPRRAAAAAARRGPAVPGLHPAPGAAGADRVFGG